MIFENGFHHWNQHAKYYQKQRLTQNPYFVQCDSFRVGASQLNTVLIFNEKINVMRQHEISRIVRNMDFELSIVSGSTLHADSNSEKRFQIS